MKVMVEFARGGDPDGTSLVGYVEMPYAAVVAVLGEPEEGDGDKVDCEWTVTFPGGVVGSLYNYKDGPAYLGAAGVHPKDRETYEWHIGGHDPEVVALMQDALGAPMACVRRRSGGGQAGGCASLSDRAARDHRAVAQIHHLYQVAHFPSHRSTLAFPAHQRARNPYRWRALRRAVARTARAGRVVRAVARAWAVACALAALGLLALARWLLVAALVLPLGGCMFWWF
jgi:hypothetical protein